MQSAPSNVLRGRQVAERKTGVSTSPRELPDPLARDVYGIMGIPIDKVCLQTVIDRLKDAAETGDAFVLSTPNLNFMILSQTDSDFRESLLVSDLCPADGMPIVWLGRLLGVPLEGRIAGSDIFDAMRSDQSTDRAMRLFLFGGADGLGTFVADKINATSGSMICVGAISPGFGTVEQLSAAEHIERINASRADFVAAFLGAKKGQDWLMQNHARLSVPIRAHLGATINYQAGKVSRAPEILRRCGLEWLWRIKEEPYLWRRYLNDGAALMRMLAGSVLPLLAYRSYRKWSKPHGEAVRISAVGGRDATTVLLEGEATERNIAQLVPEFRKALSIGKSVMVDLSRTTAIDPRVLGLLLVVRKELKRSDRQFQVVCDNGPLRRIVGLYGFGYLLS